MTKLHLIAGITPALQHLLEAGGIASVEVLAQQEAGALSQRLKKLAKSHRGAGPVSRDDLARLIALARTLVGGSGTARPEGHGLEPGDLSVNLDRVPEAIAVTPKRSAVPAAPVATPSAMAAAAPAVPVRPAALVPPPATPAPARPAASIEAEAPRAAAPVAKEPPKLKFRDFQDYEEGRIGVAPLPRRSADDEEAVQGALQRLNYKPGEPIPRGVRRGVPHPRPYYLVFCSLIVLATRLLTLAVIIGTPIVLWPAFMQGDKTHLITFLWVIGAWVVSGLLYLLFALRARCRVCTNHIFWSKRCFKNQKAHRLWGLGLVGSLALHALLFGWFRCMYCGTAIRLKFVADPERSR
jgi:hypothetical protein